MSLLEMVFSFFSTERKDDKQIRVWKGKTGTYVKQGGKGRQGATLFYEKTKNK